MFQRLFDKIEQQRGVYGDQVYDVLGDSEINRSLQDLLIEAIRDGKDPAVLAEVDEIIDARDRQPARRRARRASPGVERAGPSAASSRSATAWRKRSPASSSQGSSRRSSPPRSTTSADASRPRSRPLRDHPRPGHGAIPRPRVAAGGPVHERLRPSHVRQGPRQHRPTDERCPSRADHARAIRCSRRVIDTVLDRHGDTLATGTTLRRSHRPRRRHLGCSSTSTTPSPTAASSTATATVVSRRFQFVEITADGDITDPGAEPYIDYEPARRRDTSRSSPDSTRPGPTTASSRPRASWAIANLATPHFDEIAAVTKARIARDSARRRRAPQQRDPLLGRRADELKATGARTARSHGSTPAAPDNAPTTSKPARHADFANSTSRPTSSTTRRPSSPPRSSSRKDLLDRSLAARQPKSTTEVDQRRPTAEPSPQ